MINRGANSIGICPASVASYTALPSVLAANNPHATIVHSAGAATALAGLTTAIAEPGEELTINAVKIVVTGSGAHASIHPDLPGSDNNGYLIEGAVPIHQAGLTPAHQQLHHQLLTNLAPSGTDVVVLEHATPRTV